MASGRKPTGRPTAARAAAIRDATIRATLDALADQHIDFSMDRIAAAAGISKQAIYRRWPGKVDLILDALDHDLDVRIARAAAALPTDPEDALHEMAWRMFDADGECALRTSIFVQIEALRSAALRERMLEWRQAFVGLFAEQILRARDGRIDRAGAVVIAEILQEMLIGARNTLVWTRAPADTARDRFQERWRLFVRLMPR